MSKNQRKTTEQFIEEAIDVHQDLYKYDKVNYTNAHTKVEIYCNKCEKYFFQVARTHLKGSGCQTCGNIKKGLSRRSSQEEFIRKAKEIHGDKYDYSKFIYEKSIIKSTIICNTCKNIFEQDAHSHIDKKAGCPKCGALAPTNVTRFSQDEFIKKAKEIHDTKYNYDRLIYINSTGYVEIGCNKCGKWFFQVANSHLQGCGCRYCKIKECGIKRRLTQDEFLEKAIQKHGTKYDYTNSVYDGNKNKISIFCLKCKNEFKMAAQDHLAGQGCSKCKFSKGEIEIEKILKEYKLEYETQKKFEDCKYKNYLYFDFYIKKYNLCIEFDGELHFKSIEYFGGDEGLKVRQFRDEIKNEYCKKNNINLLRIRYDERIESKLISTFLVYEIIYNL